MADRKSKKGPSGKNSTTGGPTPPGGGPRPGGHNELSHAMRMQRLDRANLSKGPSKSSGVKRGRR